MIGTTTGRFCPEIYAMEAFIALTVPLMENNCVLFIFFGTVSTVQVGTAVRPITSILGQEPGTMN